MCMCVCVCVLCVYVCVLIKNNCMTLMIVFTNS